MPTVGVLALQGAFAKHLTMLRSLGAGAVEVRTTSQLEACDALIIPGGESTTMMKQLDFAKMRAPLLAFASAKPVFGTCAGLVMMSQQITTSQPFQPLALLDIEVERNGFGRQIDSFTEPVQLQIKGKKRDPFRAIFIRAPRIKATSGAVEVLASHGEEPILVQQGHHLGATFHPELANNASIHQFFLSLIK